MKLSTNLQRFHNRTTYYLSVVGFFVIIALVIGAIYYATRQIDYVWRWYKVPQYFVYEETVEIKSEIDGDVEKIEISGGDATISVKGVDGSVATYHVPSKADLRVADGDMRERRPMRTKPARATRTGAWVV